MIKIVSTAGDNKLKELSRIEDGAWVHLTDPSREEVSKVSRELGIEEDFLRAALDEEETARIETEDGVTLVVVDIPVVVPDGESFFYDCTPLGIIITEKNFITVCLEDTGVIEDFWVGRVRGVDTHKKTRLMLQMFYKNSSKYLLYLRQIYKASSQMENALHKSMKNRELMQMLKLEKSLVFFSTSLQSNEVVLEKLLKSGMVRKYPDDEDLLEDVIIENKQAIEMCHIYRDILSGTMDAFASVISNNLNMVMKLLASVTIVLAIPTIFFSLWGINTGVPWQGDIMGFWIVIGIAVVVTGAVALLLWKKKMF